MSTNDNALLDYSGLQRYNNHIELALSKKKDRPINESAGLIQDGNPVGTIISYMGTIAPQDYLICDGTIYNIIDYSELSEFFEIQFGSKNYFGGDGTTTFAVPDMRNLFLRGYHGSAAALSGNIGVKQSATEHPNVQIRGDVILGFTGNSVSDTASIPVNNSDTATTMRAGTYTTTHGASSEKLSATYTSRPVNMAVLYCIKAAQAELIPGGGTSMEAYSTEEQVIGTWIDGRPLYRKCFISTSPSAQGEIGTLVSLPNIVPVNIYGNLIVGDDANFIVPINCAADGAYVFTWYFGGAIAMQQGHFDNAFSGKPVNLVVEYTKTTDQNLAQLSTTATSISFDLNAQAMPTAAVTAGSPVTDFGVDILDIEGEEFG